MLLTETCFCLQLYGTQFNGDQKALESNTQCSIHNLKRVCLYLSRDVRLNQLEHMHLRVSIFTVPLDSVMDRAKSSASFGMKLKYICIYKIT